MYFWRRRFVLSSRGGIGLALWGFWDLDFGPWDLDQTSIFFLSFLFFFALEMGRNE